MGTVWLTNKATGTEEPVPDVEVTAALASGKYAAPDAIAVHRQGVDTYTTPETALRDQAFEPTIDPAVLAAQQGHQIRERANTGVGPALRAFAGGAASGLTFGLVDPYQEEQEFNPLAAVPGQIAGAIAPAFVGDVGGLLGIGSKGARLADDALSLERAGSSLSSKALYTGEAVTDSDRALASAGKAVDRTAAAAAERAAAGSVDLSTLDSAGLRAAEKSERDAIIAARQPDREAFVAAVNDHAAATQAEELWQYTSKHPSRTVRGLGKESREADYKVIGLLKNEEGLVRDPSRIRDALERQAQALRKIESEGLTEYAQFERDFARGPQTIRQEIIDGKMKGYVVGKGGLSPTSPLIDEAVEREMVKRFGTADMNSPPTLPARLQAVMDSGGTARTRVLSLRESLEALTAEPTSARLSQIEAELTARGLPKQASVGTAVLSAVAPFAGPLGMAVAAGSHVLGSLKKIAAAVGARAGRAAESFLDVTSKVARTPQVPVLATATLASLAYGKSKGEQGPSDLPGLFKARTDEIKNQVHIAADGSFQMRPEARQELASKLRAVRAVDPILADRLETAGARRIEWLASQIPRRPDAFATSYGPDRWQPSDLDMRSWARKAAAVEDPSAVFERVVHGTVTPEDAEAMRAVWPEKMQDFIRQVASGLTGLQKALPYSRRMALSLFTGQPVDPALDPKIFAVLQSQFPDEPGSQGGTQAPKATPSFGSMPKSPDAPTPSQYRAQGAVHA